MAWRRQRQRASAAEACRAAASSASAAAWLSQTGEASVDAGSQPAIRQARAASAQSQA